MGTRYKLYILKELEVINDYSNIETLDEILDLNARFYPVAEYFRIEYGFYQEENEILHLNLEELMKLLEIIENKTIFNYIDENEWFEDYGKFYYNDKLDNGKYIEYNWGDNTETIKTFDDIIQEFYNDLKTEISECLEDCILDKIDNYYFKSVWED